MGLDLYEHNQKTYNDVMDFLNKNEDCCVVNPCGSGKSAIMAKLILDHPDQKFLIFTRQKNAKEYYFKNYKEILSNAKVNVITYSRMLSDFKKNSTESYKADMYLIDEAHYIGANTWGLAFQAIVEQYKPRLIGFTATPQRFADQGTDNTIVSEFFNNNSAGNFTTKDLQAKGLFIEPEYIMGLYNLESEVIKKLETIQNSDLEDWRKEKYAQKFDDITEHWNKYDCPAKILKKIDKYLYQKKGNKILVYTSDIQDLHEKERLITPIIRKLYKNKKISVYTYHTKNDKALTQFENDKDSYIKILYSVDKVMETIHMNDLNIVIMLRPSISNRIITQQFGRVNNVNNPNKSLIIDMVGNLDNLNTIKFLGGTNDHANNPDNTHIDMSALKHVSVYNDIFAEIDKVTKKGNRFNYKGYVGSLTKICKIFNKDYADAKKLMTEGYDIIEAVENAKTKAYKITDEIMSGYVSHEKSELTNDQNAFKDHAIKVADNFINNHSITDDDERQELYLFALEALSNIDVNKPKYQITAYIAHYLDNKYMLLKKTKVRHDDIWTYIADVPSEIHRMSIEYYNEHPIESVITDQEFKETMNQVLRTLTDRERIIIRMRYGFCYESEIDDDNISEEDIRKYYDGTPKFLEDVGRRLRITRNRVHQIEARAMRKLQHPSRSRRLKTFMYEDYMPTPNDYRKVYHEPITTYDEEEPSSNSVSPKERISENYTPNKFEHWSATAVLEHFDIDDFENIPDEKYLELWNAEDYLYKSMAIATKVIRYIYKKYNDLFERYETLNESEIKSLSAMSSQDPYWMLQEINDKLKYTYAIDELFKEKIQPSHRLYDAICIAVHKAAIKYGISVKSLKQHISENKDTWVNCTKDYIQKRYNIDSLEIDKMIHAFFNMLSK